MTGNTSTPKDEKYTERDIRAASNILISAVNGSKFGETTILSAINAMNEAGQQILTDMYAKDKTTKDTKPKKSKTPLVLFLLTFIGAILWMGTQP